MYLKKKIISGNWISQNICLLIFESLKLQIYNWTVRTRIPKKGEKKKMGEKSYPLLKFEWEQNFCFKIVTFWHNFQEQKMKLFLHMHKLRPLSIFRSLNIFLTNIIWRVCYINWIAKFLFLWVSYDTYFFVNFVCWKVFSLDTCILRKVAMFFLKKFLPL